jgi:small basic protein
MLWTIIGVLTGLVIGLVTNLEIPIGLIKYTAVLIIVILDSLLGALKAEIDHEKYDAVIFVTGIFFNGILALAITLLGESLGLDLYLAVTVVFTFRIFANLGTLRRAIIKEITKKK